MSKVIPLFVVQNVDKIARKEDYAHLKENELLVHGVFGTLQGEGPFVGAPCVFIRLAGCNFGDKEGFCEFCDTDFKLSSGKVKTFEELFRDVLIEWSKIGSAEPLIVLTGGEPGLQHPQVISFINYVNSRGWHVQVETNGTQGKFANDLKSQLAMSSASQPKVTLVISPKAGPKGYGALNLETWAWGKNVLKVLVDHRQESQYSSLPKYILDWKKLGYGTYLSPIAVYLKEYKGEVSSAWEEGLVNRELTRRNYNYAATLCKTHGFKLSIQQHLFAEIE